MSAKRSRSGNTEGSPNAKAPIDLESEVNVDGDDAIDVDSDESFMRYTARNGAKCLVCKLCYTSFESKQDEGVWAKVGRGFKGVLSENATAQTKLAHTKMSHSSSAAASSIAPTTTLRQTTLENCGFRGSNEDDCALLWTVLGASHRLVKHKQVQKMLGQMLRAARCDTRAKMRLQIQATSQKLKLSILQKMKGKTAFLAMDAGTLLRKCFLNVCVAVDSRIFFWKSFLGRRMTADFVGKVIERCVPNLR